MDYITPNLARELAEAEDKCCASLYMPTRQGSDGDRENRTRLKNLLAAIESRQAERGMRTTVARDLAHAAWEAADQPAGWPADCHGVAGFLSESRMQFFRLPYSLPERAVVGRRFQVTPLLPYQTDGSFWLLELSERHARLLRGDRWRLEMERELPENPKSDAKLADHQTSRQEHGGIRQGSRRQTVFTGQGGAPDKSKPEALAYCQLIDRALHDVLRNSHDPLVIAAVESTASLYRQATKYESVMPVTIEGNPSLHSRDTLHRRGWEIVEPRFRGESAAVLQQCVRNAARDSTTTELHEILRAAFAGRVEALMVEPDACCWGSYDAASEEFHLIDAGSPEAEDVLNLAVTETLKRGGKAYSGELARAGISAPIAAIYRYSNPGADTRAGARLSQARSRFLSKPKHGAQS